ncbi:MAG: DUF4190 domain-containing protein, partial [Victivallales bacterium]|nr:DUF4190 domain-containing protein [Victivallales bacterium]
MQENLYNEILETELPNHYQLLGLKLFEGDQGLIHQAALRQMKKLKAWDLHEDKSTSVQIKRMHVQLSLAISDLEDPEKKIAYDTSLAEKLGIPLPGSQTETTKDKKSKLRENEGIVVMSSGQPHEKLSLKQSDKSTTQCPECSTPIAKTDSICPGCGFNPHTGKKENVLWSDYTNSAVEINKGKRKGAATSNSCPFAKASLALGILSLFCLGAFAGIPAVILGILSLGRISRLNLAGKGLAITGTVLGSLSSVASIAFFAVSISQARQEALAARSAENLKNLSLALNMYAQDYDGLFPDKDGAEGIAMLYPSYLTDQEGLAVKKGKYPPSEELSEDSIDYQYIGGRGVHSVNQPVAWDKFTNFKKRGNVLYSDGTVATLANEDWLEM